MNGTKAFILTVFPVILSLFSCSETDHVTFPNSRETTVSFKFGISPHTRAMDPDEMKISDISIFIFNEYGILESRTYISGLSEREISGEVRWEADLVRNGKYSVYACANFGYELNAGSIDELKSLRYHLAYPDDYSLGMPMSGCMENVTVSDEEISVPLERLMAKISVKVDRSRLDEDVEFLIHSIQVEGCPRSVYPFSRNHIRDPFDFFPSGFLREDYETDILNTGNTDGTSGEVILYMLENMQGDLLPGNTDETGKVLPENNPARDFCSYIEVKADYVSSSGYSKPGEYLIYRFYPGENPSNFDICRNSSYSICITPVGSGLNGTEWRIDKSGLDISGQILELSYSDLDLTYIGEQVRIQAFLTPDYASPSGLTWESDDISVATVSDDGMVTACGEGTCTVRCSIADGSGTSSECRVRVEFMPYYLKVYPGQFIRCRKGDVLRFECDYFPEETVFDIGTEELEYDRKRGIYDYLISEDGKSVTIYTKAKGSGLLYMEAGYPINDAEMVVLVID